MLGPGMRGAGASAQEVRVEQESVRRRGRRKGPGGWSPQKGLCVQMPQNSFQKDGKTEYSDIFHPITADARAELNGKVLEAYEQKLDEVESESEDLDEDEDLDESEDAPAFGQSM